ncbi:histidine kinase [Teredinibacter turnerae]|uniref:hypothetical protein n=1 Tax=Teredinibacter turnerae TaxID=2426 RepID=UPI0003731B99|nr:hypothetical protein [Teredinibacter turnerae]
MNKLASIALVALLSNVAVSGEVGALDPQNSSASSYDVALAEIGSSKSWVATDDFRVVPVETVNSRQEAELNAHMISVNSKVNNSLNALIEQKVAQSLR